MELYVADARELRENCNRGLLALMNQIGVQTESEAVSGYVIKWAKKRNKKSKFEHHDITVKAVQKYKSQWTKGFEGEFMDENKTTDYSKKHSIEAKAAAWYYVSYHPDKRRRDLSLEDGLFSFPWCVLEYICEAAKRSSRERCDVESHFLVTEEKIQEGAAKLMKIKNTVAPLIIEIDDDDDDSDEGTEDEGNDDSDNENSRFPINNKMNNSCPLVHPASASPRAQNNNNGNSNTSTTT